MKILKCFGNFAIGEQVLHNVKYADELCYCLQGIIDRLIGIGRYFGMKINVGKSKVIRISRQPSSLQIMTDQTQLENME
jgi:hypothetical protein